MKWLALVVVLSCSAPATAPRARPPAPQRVIADPPPSVGPLPDLPVGRLPRTFVPIRYAAALEVAPERTLFTGTIAITGSLAEPSDIIWLNAQGLTIHRVVATQGDSTQRLAATLPATDLLALQSPAPLAAGEWTITIEYSGSWNDHEAAGGFREHGYVFTQFEPDYARRVFPCLDEPDRKVPWQLTITAPANLEVASNTPVASKTVQPNGTQVVEFAPTTPLPSYLIAFAVGPFDVVDAGRSRQGIPIRILTQKGRAADAAYEASATAGLLDTVETWLGVPFAYPKLDIVTVPATASWWFAMENPGLITIGARALDSTSSWDGVISHEIAHHWFGDLVTLAWWDDLWLNEAFADWLAAAAYGRAPPGEDVETMAGTIVDRVTNARDFVDRHRAIHSKGPALLSRLAQYVGSDRFRAALQAYLRGHAHASVTTADFAAALSTIAGEDLRVLLESYLTTGSDHVRTTQLQCTGKKYSLAVTGLELPETIVCVGYDRDGKRADVCRRLARSAPGFDIDAKRCPRWVVPEKVELADVPALRDRAWNQLRDDERRRLLQLANSRSGAEPDLQWSIISKIASTQDASTLELLGVILTVTRSQLTDVAVRNRFDAWIRTAFGTRQIRFDTNLLLASVLALAGDATLLEAARALAGRTDAADELRAQAVAVVATVDKSFANQLFDKVLAADRDQTYRYALPLRASPFRLELLRERAAEVDGFHAQSIFGHCNAPVADIIATAKALSPDAWEGFITARELAECDAQNKRAMDAVRKFLDAQKP